jgi:PAS domain S-box-containing protein
VLRYVNPVIVERLGRPADEIVGKHARDVFGEHGFEARHADLVRALAGERVVRRGAAVETDRSGGDTRSHYVPDVDSEGRVHGVLAFVEDVGELVRAERRASESERRYRALLETANEGILAVGADFRITFANRRVAAMLGVKPDELVGLHVSDLGDADGIAIQAKRAEQRRAGVAERFETTLRRKDGSPLTVLVSTSPLFDEAGEFRGAIGMISDLTERRELTEQLRQSQKMEAVGRLAGGIAHDFNNVLSVILSFNALAQLDLPDASPAQEHLREVQRAAERAAELTKQLLAYSRKQLLKPRVLDPDDLVREQGPMLRRLIGEDVELSFVLRAQSRVRADPGQVAQVLMNLAVNARDAMPEGGTLTVATRDVELSAAEAQRLELVAGRYVMISVTDTGHGMDDETAARAFEPFFTTKAQGSGTGLGLSTVFGIVKQSGGGVALDSEPGGGTTLALYFPATPEDAARTPTSAPRTPASSAGERVLVVEDDPQLRALAVNVLRRAGHAVLEAADPVSALEVAADFQGDIHLLLTDIVMPHMNGRQLADRLRDKRPRTRVLYMSGYTEDAIAHRGILEPGVAFLPKPLTPGDLLAAVRRVLDEGRAAAP